MAQRYPVAQWVALAWVAVLAGTLPIRYFHADDGWLLNFTYYVSQLGYCKTDMFGDYHGYTDRLLVWHKGWVGQGALILKGFGYGIVPLKALSALYAVSALAVLYRLGRMYGLGARLAWLPLALLMFHPYFFDHAGVYRPEAAVTFAGLVSVLALARYRQTGRVWWAIGAGAASGLAALFHLNGLCIIVATLGTLVYERRWLQALLAGVAAAAVLALYTADMGWPGSVSIFWDQLSHDPALKPGRQWYTPLLQLAKEYQRYFRSWRDSGFSLAILAMVIVAGGLLWRQAKALVVWLCIGMLALALLARDTVPYYSIYFMPLMALLWAMAWQDWQPRLRWQQMGLAISILGISLHLLAGTASNAYMLIGPRGADTRRDMERAFALVGDSPMVGPPEMMCLRTPEPKLRIHQAYGRRLPGKRKDYYFLEKAPADGFRWALIDTRMRHQFIPDTTPWQTVFKGPRFTLFKAK